MKIRVVDLETTGLPEDEVKAICEIGWTDFNARWEFDGPHAAIVNPGHPIPPTTRAIHHISDEEAKTGISPSEACATLMAGMEPDDVFAAHNAEFERHFFGGGNHRWICTMKCAQHLFPDAPSHSNQVLRYWLNLDGDGMDSVAAMPPHRAGPDTLVTAYLISRMLLMASCDELVRLTTAPVILTKVTFGKHRGSKWADLPRDYLQWIAYKSDLGSDEKHTARHFLGENE